MKMCAVCGVRPVHVNYEYEGGVGHCGPACEKKEFDEVARREPSFPLPRVIFEDAEDLMLGGGLYDDGGRG